MTGSAPEKFTYIQAIKSALDEALEKDSQVILFGEDVGDKEGGGVMTVTAGLSTKFGDERVRTTPISEQAIAGAGVGAALAGMRPVVEIMLMNFMTVAMDQVVNHAAKLRFMSGGATNVPLTIRTMTGAGVAAGGQHSDMLEAWFAHTAGIKVVLPSSPADAKGLLLSCIFDNDPCIFVENTASYGMSGPVLPPGTTIPLGKANILGEGSDVTLITYGPRQVADSLVVSEKLAKSGVSVEIIDLRTVAPFDKETVLESVRKTGRAVIVHEAVRNFGVGAEISACIGEEVLDSLKAPVQRIGSVYAPVPFSEPLEQAWMPSQAEIEAAVLQCMK